MHNYKELRVWQKAVELCAAVYNLCTQFPPEEKYGLKSQMQRSAISIASNIAEGQAGILTKNSSISSQSQTVLAMSWKLSY